MSAWAAEEEDEEGDEEGDDEDEDDVTEAMDAVGLKYDWS
jgi:hypothetical protein